MRIAVVIGSSSRKGGGVSEVARLITNGLAETTCYDLCVLTLRDEFSEEDRAGWGQVKVEAFPCFGPRTFGFSPALLRAVLRSRADLIHVHGVWMFHCAAVLAWSMFTGGRYIITPHGMLERWIRRRSPLLKKIVSVLFHDRFLRRASSFQVLTEKEIQDVEEVVGPRPIRVIPNYVDLARDTPIGKPHWWRDGFADRDVYLYFGRIHEKKGCLELCKAWEQLCGREEAFRGKSILIFCGWIDQLPEFEASVLALNAKFDNIYFCGPQYGDDKDNSFAAASFVLLPSKSEGLPMTILEAWAYAKPVLMTRACNLTAAFAAGAAVEIGQDASSIAAKLYSISYMDRQSRKTLGATGRRYAKARFSKEAVLRQMNELYETVLSETSSAKKGGQYP